MKKNLLFAFVFFWSFSLAKAQINFFDDFESYNPGDMISASSPNWSTWSGGVPGEDAPISTDQAYSGNNSLKLQAGSPGGGPADVVLPFGGAYYNGTFNFSTYFYIVANNGAYFNFQAVDPPGTSWAIEFYFNQDGSLTISNIEDGMVINGEYPHNAWFHFEVNIDLTANQWEVFLDGISLGSFSNSNNSVASADFFPYEANTGNSLFYIDDVSYEYQAPMLEALDVAITAVNAPHVGIAGETLAIGGTLKNTGINTINSVDITWTNGSDQYTETLNGLSLPSLASMDFTFSTPVPLQSNSNEITVSLSNPNGNTDMNPDNNQSSILVFAYTPAAGKMILAEEATGTWCGWCPRGAVFMDYMAQTYPDYFVGVAVHNGDPMAITEYDNGITSFPGFQGFPSVVVDRDELIDPADLETTALPRLITPPAALLLNKASYDEASGLLTISLEATFQEAVSGDYRLNIAIIEDGVTGTGSGYNQVNYYSGGGAGPMGGYENLPDPVPASQMVYNHVARAILGGFEGPSNSLPASINSGEVHSYTFTYVLPPNYEYDQIKIVGMLLNPDGSVNNVTETTIDEAIANSSVATYTAQAEDLHIQTWPNPFTEQLNLRLTLTETENVSLEVLDAYGHTVSSRNYGPMQGNLILPFRPKHLPKGLYYFKLRIGNKLTTTKAVLE